MTGPGMAGPIMSSQGLNGAYGSPQIIGQSVTPTGSVFLGQPTQFGTPPTITPVPAPIQQ